MFLGVAVFYSFVILVWLEINLIALTVNEIFHSLTKSRWNAFSFSN